MQGSQSTSLKSLQSEIRGRILSPGMVFVVTGWRILVIDSDGGGFFGVFCLFCSVDWFAFSERKKEV